MGRRAAATAAQEALAAAVMDSEEDAPEANDTEERSTTADADASTPTSAPSTPTQAKRKRAEAPTPGTLDEEAELARRRRRRQSLVFAQRRKSLTHGSKGSGQDKPNPQYISDMYSTIIKMSSENKINVKNSWSLHLIDHMEDILSAPQEDAQAADDNTFNFQKASCTLDASVKIYSYRVDDTWTSSFKILENLSRNDKRQDTAATQDAEHASDGEDGEDDEEAARRTKKKGARKAASVRTIERNLNNITLRSLELEFEPDPLFHKMSQTFDEGGAKGLLLANLGVYDGAKILLNSADVQLSTRRLTSSGKEEEESDTPEIPATVTEENADGDASAPPVSVAPAPQTWSPTLDISSLGNLSCFSRDILSLGICPPLQRLYKQVDELRGPDASSHKVVLQEKVLKFDASTLPGLLPVSVRAPSNEADGTVDSSDVMADAHDSGPDAGENWEPDDDNNGVDPDVEEMDVDFDAGSEANASQRESVLETTRRESLVDPSGRESVLDASRRDSAVSFGIGGSPQRRQSTLSQTDYEDANEADDENGEEDSVIDPVLPDDLDDRTDSKTIRSATDYFRSQEEHDPVKEEADMAYSRLIETVLMRSGDQPAADPNDYAYFDAKVIKNWAGPTHNKFRSTRKNALKTISEDFPELDDAHNDASSKGTHKSRKGDKKTAIINFLSVEVPDLDLLLKPPKVTSSICMSKVMLRHHSEKSSDLVFPVDAHIDTQCFFQHFLKPRLRIFPRRGDLKKRASLAPSQMGNEPLPDVTRDFSDQDFGVTDYGSDDGGASVPDDDGVYASEGLLQAERVVEKIDIQYERVAKRVDVKKLKTSIWTHIEKETPIGKQMRVTGRKRAQNSEGGEPEGEQSDVEELTDAMQSLTTTTNFHSVVERVANKVPSNVTVSFYFICMLHLANEKGLKLVGQDDLSNFEIVKDEET